MRADGITALSVLAEQEVELKGVIVDWQDARIISGGKVQKGSYVYKGCLFISQRHQWIDFRRSTCRDVTGQ